MTGSDRAPAESTADPALGDVEAEFPRWHCWQGISGLYYASLRRSSPVPPLTYIVDLADWRGQPARASGNLRQVTKAIEGLAAKISKQK